MILLNKARKRDEKDVYGDAKRELTKYPSVGFHFVPIVNDIDAHTEANKLQDRACKAQLNHKVSVSSRLLLDFSRLLLLHDQLLLELIDDCLGAT